jgi:hypothetical protein
MHKSKKYRSEGYRKNLNSRPVALNDDNINLATTTLNTKEPSETPDSNNAEENTKKPHLPIACSTNAPPPTEGKLHEEKTKMPIPCSAKRPES